MLLSLNIQKQKSAKFSKSFIDEYHPRQSSVINPENYHDFLTKNMTFQRV